jgi:hypothetical protein
MYYTYAVSSPLGFFMRSEKKHVIVEPCYRDNGPFIFIWVYQSSSSVSVPSLYPIDILIFCMPVHETTFRIGL